MKILCKPENETEAIAIKALLEANSIYPSLLSFHDSAYDGIYQGQQGWGSIKVNDADHAKAMALLVDWKESAPNTVETLTSLAQSESDSDQQDINSLGYKHFLVPMLLSLSVLFNILCFTMYLSLKNKTTKDHDQYDRNNFLMGRVEWRKNKNRPYKYTSYLRNGKIGSIAIDSNDDGRVDKLIIPLPNSEETYLDKDNSGFFEICDIEFKSGSHIRYKDHDQNGIYESAVITISTGKIYTLTLSNLNGFVLMITTPSGDSLNLDVLKKIAVSL